MILFSYILKVLTPHLIKNVIYFDYKLYFQINMGHVFSFVYFLKNHSLFFFKSLVDINVVDTPEKLNRFTITYCLLNYIYNSKVFITINCNETSSVYSVVKLFRSANWIEREVWDMFGVNFLYNKDLRRILTDYGFNGYPLRKDFPVFGFIELFYDRKRGELLYNNVVLMQEYRSFVFEDFDLESELRYFVPVLKISVIPSSEEFSLVKYKIFT